MNADAWEELLVGYPDKTFGRTLASIARYGAKLGYQGPRKLLHSHNLPIAESAKDFLDKELEKNLQLHRVRQYKATPLHGIFSPLGAVPKDETSWRRIHHLSSPRGGSVNDFIKPEWGCLVYDSFEDALKLVAQAGEGCFMVKRDLADTFRHIPIHPSDWWLMGFEWRGALYHELVLPFGLRTAPRIFNYFAEGLHWILESRGWGSVLHYLDDTLGVSPQGPWQNSSRLTMRQCVAS